MDSRLRAAIHAAKIIIKKKGKINLQKLKTLLSKKFSLGSVLKNSEILAQIQEKKRSRRILSLLKLRPTRTLSGVAPVAIMSMSSCPHGACAYCPKGKEAAQSYTGEEPASLRARQQKFDPYLQVRARLRQYKELGHPTSKCELIIMGGTFLAQEKKYKYNFIKRALDAFNNCNSANLEEALRRNEKAENRVVGITFETRPDYAKEKNVDEMLALGGTRVEIGVQTLSDEVYKRVNRSHTLQDVIDATRICKDAGLKICYHIMPGLFSTPAQDIQMFKTLFSDPRFQPDMLKIYPCLVLKGTKLYSLWKKGEYIPYDTETAAEVIASATKYIPRYVRVMRVQRDIPSPLIVAGVKKSNLREIVDEKLRKRGESCKCIRCREVGISLRKKGGRISKRDVRLLRYDYAASKGKEIFLSFEDTKNDLLLAFLRLRIPFRSHRKEIDAQAAIVRELHVYGSEVPVGSEAKTEIQHRGYGSKLLREAERIARDEFGKRKLVVISGVGAREYYFKQGYRRDGVYVSKKL